MKDLLENFVVIAPNCSGYWTISSFYPKSDPSFIRYNTPLIAHVFFDDFDYIKFCERYDYYTSLEPVIGPAKQNTARFKQSGLTYANHEHDGSTYPVLKFEDIDIHMMHDVIKANSEERLIRPDAGSNVWNSSFNLINKWKGRTSLGIGKEKIFLWDSSSFQTIHSAEERSELISRFNQLDGYTIFLTEKKEETYISSKKHLVYFVEQWEGQKQTDRATLDWRNNWCQAKGINVEIFKLLIDTNFLRG